MNWNGWVLIKLYLQKHGRLIWPVGHSLPALGLKYESKFWMVKYLKCFVSIG